jgi:signal transduction histidine kinase
MGRRVAVDTPAGGARRLRSTMSTSDAVAHRPARSARDWAVDIVLFLLAASFVLVVSGARLDAPVLPQPDWLFDLDQVVGVLGCSALWLRRRWPVPIAVVLVVLSSFSEFVAGAMIVALFTVAVHRRPRTSGAVFGLSLVAAAGYVVLRPEPGVPWFLLFALGAALQGAAIGWGLFIRHRRQLVLSLRDRAVRAETEAHLRAEQAQHLAREEIAREMHDVLGHRLSLLSVHAGALEYRPDAPPADVARAAKVIRESAHQALQDLREVIGVLRAPVGELPQPTFADIRQLVGESDRAGMSVELCDGVAGPVPDGVGRTAYRIVQEALTNARKHAPGSQVVVRLSGAPGTGLAVEVCNDAGETRADPAGRSPVGQGPVGQEMVGQEMVGQGLLGLSERIALAHGRVEYGPVVDGWRLAAWLPWPA